MLNTMRKNLKSLSWVLWITVASFVIALFAVWGRAGDAAGTSASWMARVNGEPVSVARFQNAYYNLNRFYQQIYQDNYDARSLGVARQALNQLIRDRLILDEARRLGLRTSPDEISRAITQDPTFQVDGQFIGVAQYKRWLSDRGVDVAGYERSVGDEMLSEKYRRLVTDSVSVSAEEVFEDYRSRNEKVKADYVLLKAEDLGAQVTVEEEALREFFQERGSDYVSLEHRRSSFVLINQERLGELEAISEEEARDYYEQNLERLYSDPGQIRVSQILLNVSADATVEEEAEARTRADDLLQRIRAGEDFAELARTYSEDTSATLGGDLGFAGPGRLQPGLEEAAFALEVGETSELVRTDTGFHIVRLTEQREASARAFSEVRDSIVRQLEFSQSQEAVSRAVADFRTEMEADPAAFEAVAQRLGLAVEDSGLVTAQDAVPGLGELPQVAQSMFRVEPGQVSPPVTLPQGTVFLKTVEARPPEPLSLEEARSQVEADYRRTEGLAQARRRLEAQVQEGADLPGVAAAFGASVESSTEFTRRMDLAPFSPEARSLAFTSPQGELSSPVEVPDGLLLFVVTERQDIDPAQFEQVEQNLRSSLLQRRRNLLFNAVVERLQSNSQIQVNEALMDRVEGRGA